MARTTEIWVRPQYPRRRRRPIAYLQRRVQAWRRCPYVHATGWYNCCKPRWHRGEHD